VRGDGPVFHLYNERFPVYTTVELDTHARERISGPLHSTVARIPNDSGRRPRQAAARQNQSGKGERLSQVRLGGCVVPRCRK
jgi:hypothetical protein